MVQELQLIDQWRKLHFRERKFTYYSNPQKSWSRIDMVWLNKEIGIETESCEILPNIWADHNPLRIKWKKQVKPNFRWTLNPQILQEQEFIDKCKKEMTIFFEENLKQPTQIQNLWDTAKAYLRGVAIAYMAKRNREKRQKQDNLQKEIQKWEKVLQEKPGEEKFKTQLTLAKHNLKLVEQEERARELKMAKQNFFEHANKPSRWLAYKLKQEKEKNIIQTLQDEDGKEYHKLEGKKQLIKTFYENLYKEEEVQEEDLINYLKENPLEKVKERHRELLNSAITNTELKKAILKQKNGKTPGPDGLPGELFKTLYENLESTLLPLYNSILEGAKIPDSWTEAYISIILKEGTDSKQIKNYRPISLLNVDYKIFSTIIAERLKLVLNEIIHTDQNGFLPKRQIRYNTRMVMNILEYYEVHSEKQAALIFLDAQKAFDNVNWQFIFQQIRNMDFGEKFGNVIRAIYTKQEARVMINRDCTEKLEIKKGVRQGCPMSPLLFILTIEVLLAQVRRNKEIRGLKIKKEEYKAQAFADDLVFFLEEPIETGKTLMAELEKYGKVAGLKINRDKTKMLVKNLTKKQKLEVQEELGLQIEKKIKYLGIWLTAKCSTIKDDNYGNFLQKLEKDLKIWKNLQLSLLGRIAVTKMNVLPKLLYLFQTIPIKLGKSFFGKLDKLIRDFVWLGKRPRINMRTLQDSKSRGGLGLPKWELYYRAAGLLWLKEWIKLQNNRILTIEGHDLQIGWHAFLWDKRNKTHSYFFRHQIREALIGIWEKVKEKHYINLPRWFSPMEAVIYPNTLEIKKMIRYTELLNNRGNLKSKEELKEQGIVIDWWPYMQIQMRFKKDKEKFGIQGTPQALDQILLGNEDKFITKMYNYLLEVDLEEDIVKGAMIAWGKNIGRNIMMEEWERFWNINCKLTLSTAYKENQYKMFYRWHYAPARLAKMYPNMKPGCWKCNNKEGTFYHMWWQCPKATNYWDQVKNWLYEITGRKIELKPEIYLLGLLDPKMEKHLQYIIIHILTAARIVYAKNWKGNDQPQKGSVIEKIFECAELDRLTLIMKGKEDKEYFKVWNLLYDWIKK